MYSVKAAMLCFYSHVIPFTMRKTRIMLWVTTAYVTIGFLTGFFTAIFACQPISRNWSLSKTDYCGSTWSSEAGIVIPSFFHLSSDLLLYCLPLPILRVLSLPKKQKIGIGITFALGFLCVFFAICVLAANYLSRYLVVGWFFACLEQTWAICVVCAPAFKLFLTRDLGGLLKRWRSKVSSATASVVMSAGKRGSAFPVYEGQSQAGTQGNGRWPSKGVIFGGGERYSLSNMHNIMQSEHSRWEVDSERGIEEVDDELTITSPHSSRASEAETAGSSRDRAPA